jgi:Ni,Fe-hydrogenase III large subunit
MTLASFKNTGSMPLSRVPSLDLGEFLGTIRENVEAGKRVSTLFGARLQAGDETAPHPVTLFAVLADDDESRLFLCSTTLPEGLDSYPSLTPSVPSVHLFEREIFEQFGIRPEGHPWLKPVRSGAASPFFAVTGEGVHEVAVGPIHAGIIEPGHFRFQCDGENVQHLEIMLGYQHRGIEGLFLEGNPSRTHVLAESIAGDSSVAHASAWAACIESLMGLDIPEAAGRARALALELERVAIHLGDLGAIAGDAAYLLGSSVFGAIRTLVINSSLALCGSRFGRGLVRVGGTTAGVDYSLKGELTATLDRVRRDAERACGNLFSLPSVIDRLERIGVVDGASAHAIGMVGPAARASGVRLDVREDHPWGAYLKRPIHKYALESGDVFARSYIRYLEIVQSLDVIRDLLAEFPTDGPMMAPEGPGLAPRSIAVSLVEGWRGEICHVAITDGDGRLARYKIKDPSFNNWYGLALAVRGNAISDFPLCNKSFNLSYAGFDL